MDSIKVKRSTFGLGVFADKNFKKGETICFMEGKNANLEDFRSVNSKNRNILVDPLQIDDKEYIYLDEPYIFINHSCSPNAGIKGKNELSAIRNIKKGEEIFYDYSTTMDEGLNCSCGSKNCRGKIGDFLMLPKHMQKKYANLGAVPDFIKEKMHQDL